MTTESEVQPSHRLEPRAHLDTSGIVDLGEYDPKEIIPGERAYRWPDLSPFVQGYVETMFASFRISPSTEARSAVDKMRARDRTCVNIPLLLEQSKALRTRCHWSATHSWPTVRDELTLLGLLTVVAKGGNDTVTEPTVLGREVGGSLLAFSDLAPETLARIMEDCRRDQDIGDRLGNGEDRSSVKAGRAYWKERQSGQLFDELPQTLYLGDDGKVYLRDTA